ncbi:Multicopper oxidase [Planctomycetes bacterium Poly30]|uniref:Multicopper oxidase n=1 Tax=Saltatorellus ferox TaxID=2528018 RepID=A0A518EL96_9BACT|nr:Multicopper oxidase [Planctomycetes bacterium Poly30]
MDHHLIRLHGVEFCGTPRHGVSVPAEQQRKRVTVPVVAGATRDIEFVPAYPGDWAFHCHMTPT